MSIIATATARTATLQDCPTETFPRFRDQFGVERTNIACPPWCTRGFRVNTRFDAKNGIDEYEHLHCGDVYTIESAITETTPDITEPHTFRSAVTVELERGDYEMPGAPWIGTVSIRIVSDESVFTAGSARELARKLLELADAADGVR